MSARHHRRARLAWIATIVIAWLTAATPTVLAQALETFTLGYRTAEELIPLLQPLVPDDAVVTGTGDVLLVRGDEATVQRIRDALAALDRAPRQLLITVGQGTLSGSRASAVRGSGTIGSGDVQVGVNRPPASESGAQVQVRQDAMRDDIGHVASVRALEGRETFIAMGESRPFTSTSVVRDDRRGSTIHREETTYHDVQSGFYATPRIVGDRVTLEISPTQQRVTYAGAQQPAVATRTIVTTVAGRLGEWISLGGVTGTATGSSRGIATAGTQTSASAYAAWVRVEEVP